MMELLHDKNPLVRSLRLVILALLILFFIQFLLLIVLPLFQISSDGENSNRNFDDIEPLSEPSPRADYQESIDRALFSWDRKPVFSTAKAAQEEDIASRWQLSGVVNTPDDRQAIFIKVDKDQWLKLREGTYLERWKIESISTESVILVGDQGEVVLHISEDKGEPAEAEEENSPEEDNPISEEDPSSEKTE